MKYLTLFLLGLATAPFLCLLYSDLNGLVVRRIKQWRTGLRQRLLKALHGWRFTAIQTACYISAPLLILFGPFAIYIWLFSRPFMETRMEFGFLFIVQGLTFRILDYLAK